MPLHFLKTLFATLIFVTFFATQVQAEADFWQPDIVGSSAYMIRIGNIDGFNDYSASIFENPASLYRTRKGSASLFNTTLMGEVDYKNISGAYRTSFGVFGIGYSVVGVSDIPLTREVVVDAVLGDSFFEQIGSFGYEASMIKLGYQFSQTKHFHIGIAGNLYNFSLNDVTGDGFNVDAGIVLDSYPLVFSAVFKNMFSSMKMKYSNGGQENLALQSVFAVKYTLNDIDAFAQLKIPGSSRKWMRAFGLNYRPKFASFLQISGGMKELQVIENIVSKSTVGIGLDLMGVAFDYAFESSDHPLFNGMHYFSIGFDL